MLVLFAVLPARRAVIIAFVAAWLFLPVMGYKLQGIPDFSKVTATCIGAALGTVLFDAQRLFAFRAKLHDIPMAVWCVVPLFSSLATGFGLYDGMSGVLRQTVMWGFPYLIGRLYLGELEGLRELAIAIVVGAIVYVPLCVLEMRLSPQLHAWVYGFWTQRNLTQSRRWGGYRPTVFMQHGLAVALFMGTSAVIALWFWVSGAVRSMFLLPTWCIAVVLGLVAVLCKSTGAIVEATLAAGSLMAARYLRIKLMMVLFALIPLCYILARTVGGWDGGELLDVVRTYAPDRAQSLQFRLRSENGVQEMIEPHSWLGRSRFDLAGTTSAGSEGQRIIGDAMWIIALGKYGILGLTSWLAAMVLPVLLVVRRWAVLRWADPVVGPSIALAAILASQTCDDIFNAMLNPLYLLVAGGLVGVGSAAARPITNMTAQGPAAGVSRKVESRSAQCLGATRSTR